MVGAYWRAMPAFDDLVKHGTCWQFNPTLPQIVCLLQQHLVQDVSVVSVAVAAIACIFLLDRVVQGLLELLESVGVEANILILFGLFWVNLRVQVMVYAFLPGLHAGA